ncbi:unnamed protein product [Microthlaspi erraticum]|uniref:Pectate lyase superfamily protein domain-containing protein n=1 Tax=Microthlaspi erraticum TaxID=1685480 RepID=A0A6D2HNF8_9BRAS|nr:unnamed protein product [Microthlaspi erraticum]
MALASAFKALWLSILFITVASRPTVMPKVFNVRRYGAKSDGKTDNANVFTNVWKSACARGGSSKIYVPKGTFYLGSVEFVGPCQNQIEFVIDGTLLAPSNPRDIKKDTSINFKYINDLYISGTGTLDGQGKQSWPLNDCHKNTNCPKLAMNMGFAFVNNSRIDGITSLNSKMGHLTFFSVHYFNITGVTPPFSLARRTKLRKFGRARRSSRRPKVTILIWKDRYLSHASRRSGMKPFGSTMRPRLIFYRDMSGKRVNEAHGGFGVSNGPSSSAKGLDRIEKRPG